MHHHPTPQEPVVTRNQCHDQGHSACLRLPTRLPFSAPGVATSPAAATPAAAAPASPRAKPMLPTTKNTVVAAQANAKGLKLEQRKERPMGKRAPENAGSDIGASAGIPYGGPTASVPRSKCAIQWVSNQSAESFIPSPDDLDDLPWAEARGGVTRLPICCSPSLSPLQPQRLTRGLGRSCLRHGPM